VRVHREREAAAILVDVVLERHEELLAPIGALLS